MFIFGMDFELLLKEFVVKRYLRIVNFSAVVAFVLFLWDFFCQLYDLALYHWNCFLRSCRVSFVFK